MFDLEEPEVLEILAEEICFIFKCHFKFLLILGGIKRFIFQCHLTIFLVL